MPALSHAFFSLSLTDQDFSFRQTSLVSHNAILTLGHMAIVLKDAQQTQQSVLARFQQRLGDPPSPLDILIINQIGCMLISSLVKKTDPINFPFINVLLFSHNPCTKKSFDYLRKLFSIRRINHMITMEC